jgi:spore coat protein U-like protein
MKRITKTLVAMAFGVSAVSAAHAATTTANFQVTANVAAACSVSASDLAFGSYSATDATALDSSSTITVTCSNGHAYDVDVGATPEARTMAGPSASVLNFGMFSDAGHLSAFAVVGASGTGAAQAHTVYGRIPAGQFGANPGAHSATVTVTVTY